MATVTDGAACSIDYPVVPAGPSFQVQVKDRDHPVRGVRIQLRGIRVTQTAETSENGTARFQNIPPGDYQIGAEFDAGMPDAAIINVRASGPRDTIVPLRWPSSSPLPVRTLKGMLRWPAIQDDQKLATLQVELLDARTGISHGSTNTAADGAFDLGTPPAGLYFLRVTPTERAPGGAGNVPIEVDARAAHSEMELEFGWSSCGTHYSARHECARQELHITSLSGQVLDPAGAAIGRATLRLLDGDGKIVEQLISDEAGRFSSQSQLAGKYELTVSAPGFTGLRQTVQAATRGSGLRIQLGLLGHCSETAVQ